MRVATKENSVFEADTVPEMKILVRCCGVRETGESAVEEILKKGIDWEKLLKLALSQKVLPLLYKKLIKINGSFVPAEKMQYIKSLYRNNALRNLQQAQNLFYVIELLSRQDIEVIAFKGPALAIQAYDNLSMRIFSDLDFLVHTKDFDKIYNTLTAAGFRSSFPLKKKMMVCWQRYRRDFEFFDGVSGLDFHHQINQGPAKISLDRKTWQHKQTIDILFREIPVLSPEHALICQCIHGTKENWNNLSSLADIAHLISRYPQLNWETLVADAQTIGCSRMLCLAVFLSRRVCGLELPEEILNLLTRQRRVKKIAETYFRQMLSGEKKIAKLQGTMALIKSLDSTAFRLSFLVNFLFTPTPLDWKTVTLPTPLYLLYYLIRPLRLFGKLLQQFFFLFFKKDQTGPGLK